MKSVLLLADGTIYYGAAIGKRGTTVGEICFNTGLTGYQEIFTDPSYYKQIIVTTHVHIGNYGTVAYEAESKFIPMAGLICKNFSDSFYRHKAEKSLQAYFEEHQITGIAGIDTRALVLHIRKNGVMNAVISSEEKPSEELHSILKSAQDMNGLELSSFVSTQEPYTLGEQNALYHVAVLDLGVKQNILRELIKRNCRLTVLPHSTAPEAILDLKPDGILLSNGPGDPNAMGYAINCVKRLVESDIPIMGICLGHQILALAYGIPTYKMQFGHRGLNHPIKNLLTGKLEITSQNHGFCIEKAAAESNKAIQITHIHLNDSTVAGIQVIGKKIFSVQYHPEASPGPHDSKYLFDQFIENMKR